MTHEYIIYCDESDKDGRHFSNFYGGLIVKTSSKERIINSLNEKKAELNLNNELKWERVTGQYLDKYIEINDKLFEFIKQGDIKIRIMFTQNIYVPQGLTAEQKDTTYTRLYYQFIKNSFGLKYAPHPVHLRIYVDNLPETRDRSEQFKDYLRNLQALKDFRDVPVRIKRENVTEIDSKKHTLLQQLDIVLGAMQFRLNDKHLQKPEGKSRRGKRTIAKEKLYTHIRKNICEALNQPNFNIGKSTSIRGAPANLWADPYRHWLFVPKDTVIDTKKSKSKTRKSPRSD